jgi:hypothetical protein
MNLCYQDVSAFMKIGFRLLCSYKIFLNNVSMESKAVKFKRVVASKQQSLQHLNFCACSR